MNRVQLEAAQHKSGSALLVAGPGAGKTKTVSERFAYLLREGYHPNQILCVTFSNDAAKEMRSRISGLTSFSEKTLRDSVCTFHSLGLRIVKSERDNLGWKLSSFPLAVHGEDYKILADLVPRQKIRVAKAYIGAQRRALISPDVSFNNASGPELELAATYVKYDQTLRQEGLIDFDGMVYWAVKIISSNTQAFSKWRAAYRQVIVDEAHDTSPDQMALAEILSGVQQNLTLVFDLSQSIYRFRGATPSVLLRDFEHKKQFYLGTNYRSGGEIIEAFKPFADSDSLSQRLVSEMRPASECYNSVVITHAFAEEYEQAREACEDIARSGQDYNQCAVLARTKAALFAFCELLKERGIPYAWKGKNFWLSPEIQNLVAYARFAVNPKDYEAFVRIGSSQSLLTRYLGKQFSEAVAAEAKEKHTSPVNINRPEGPWPEYKIEQWQEAWIALREIRHLRDRKPIDFFSNMQTVAGLFYDSENQPDNFTQENVNALLRRAAKFETLNDFVLHARKMQITRKKSNGVTLSTIHAAKGLEWDNCYVVSVSDGILPHAKAEDREEERRIMYVALSRARSFLWISWHGKPSAFIEMLPARFREAGAVERVPVAANAEQGRLAI